MKLNILLLIGFLALNLHAQETEEYYYPKLGIDIYGGLNIGTPLIADQSRNYIDQRPAKIRIGPMLGSAIGIKLGEKWRLLIDFNVTNYRAGAGSGQYLSISEGPGSIVDTFNNYQVTSDFDFWYLQNTLKFNVSLIEKAGLYLNFGGSYFKEFGKITGKILKGLHTGNIFVVQAKFVFILSLYMNHLLEM